MVDIEVIYRQNLRTAARHGPSAAELITDAPRDNEGEGASFSPTDLVATALGTCMLTTMGIVARRHEWDLTGARVRVTKEMTSNPRRIARLTVSLELPSGLSSEARKVLEQTASTCPVHRSLHPDVEIPVEFRYSDAAR